MSNGKQRGFYPARIVHLILNIGVFTGGAFLVGLMLLTVVNIIVRFFGKTVPGYYDIVLVMLVVPCSFAIVYASVQKTHVVIDILVARFTQRSQSILHVFTSFLGLGLWAVILWTSIGIIPERIRAGEYSTTIGIPYLPFRLAWVFALTILCLVLLIDLVKALGQVFRK